LNWTGHVCRMDSNRRVSRVFNNNHQGRRLRGLPKKTDGIVYKQVITKCKITNWKERSKNTADWKKYIKEEKVRIGLQWHLRRRRRRRRRRIRRRKKKEKKKKEEGRGGNE